ncbi:nuclear transport factor 2 family protein [Alphaproteobacteria bacterium]|nr:nuclear transport factor 2 family protein [Alphaproteobacteria bacterium]
MSDNVNKFFAAWGDADNNAQAKTIAETLANDARYADPRTEAPLIGPEAVANYVAQFAQMAPGAMVEAVDVAERDGITRATVEFKMANGMVQMGQYFIEMDASGKLSRLVGFVGTGTPT